MTTPAPPAPPPAPITVIPALPADPPEADGGWLPLYHYAGPGGHDDFYTASPRECNAVETVLHYTRLGSPGCVYVAPDGAVPLYRFYSRSLHTHYYTADPDARPGGPAGPPAGDWSDEGVAGYLAHGAVTAPCLTAIPTTAYVYVMGDASAGVPPGGTLVSPDPPAPATGGLPSVGLT